MLSILFSSQKVNEKLKVYVIVLLKKKERNIQIPSPNLKGTVMFCCLSLQEAAVSWNCLVAMNDLFFN